MAEEPEAPQYRDMTVDELRARIKSGETDFTAIRFQEGSDLSWIDARGLEYRLNFIESVFKGCNLEGVHLEGAILWRVNFEGAHLFEAHLEEANLWHAHLEDAFLLRAHLEGANLWQAHLERAFLSHVRLEGAFPENAHLEGAFLMYAHLERATMMEAHLEGAFLTHAHLEGADLKKARLEGASMIHAHFEEANLMYAHLEGANLMYAHLERATMMEAHLEGADLKGAHLEGADLTQTYGFETAEFDDTFVAGMIVNGVTVTEYRIGHYLKHWSAMKKWKRAKRRFEKEAAREKATGNGGGPETSKEHDPPKKPKLPVMDLSTVNGLDQIVCADSIFKRQLVDMQYLQQWEKKYPFWAFWWWITSECGRNLTLWMAWSFVIAMLFGALYANYPCQWGWVAADSSFCQEVPRVAVSVGTGDKAALDKLAILKDRGSSWVTPYYFSIVTFTTLGFGDVTPINTAGEIVLIIEVILGYFMLGGLISILANKLARRSHL